ncbi:MAG: DUF6429 family protein [Candidatus Goldiibacteriota bacterium]
MKEQIEELTLLLLYLNSWNEKIHNGEVKRAWKNHDFATIDALQEKGLISATKRAKSVYFSEEGAAKAEKLADKYGIKKGPRGED